MIDNLFLNNIDIIGSIQYKLFYLLVIHNKK